MLTLESIWRDAPPDAVVCTITGATKNMVLKAVTEGAVDFEGLTEKIRLCGDNGCAKINASGRGCFENAQSLLDIYVPAFALMTEDGGCSHGKITRRGKEGGNDGCRGCRLCG